MQQADKVVWCGDVPKRCDICSDTIKKSFVDGATRYGCWAMMCKPCHKTHGNGFGTGQGQLYQRQQEQWVKVEG